LRVSLVEFA
jgi:hypothetical protein